MFIKGIGYSEIISKDKGIYNDVIVTASIWTEIQWQHNYNTKQHHTAINVIIESFHIA